MSHIANIRRVRFARQVRISLCAALLALGTLTAGVVAAAPPAAAAVPSVDLHPVCPDPFPGIGSPCPAILPAHVVAGTTTPIAVHGSGFASAGPLTVWFTDPAITVGTPVVLSDSLFVAVINVGSNAALGGAIIHVSNSDGESFCTSCGPTVL
jgi:hypothetical protein